MIIDCDATLKEDKMDSSAHAVPAQALYGGTGISPTRVARAAVFVTPALLLVVALCSAATMSAASDGHIRSAHVHQMNHAPA